MKKIEKRISMFVHFASIFLILAGFLACTKDKSEDEQLQTTKITRKDISKTVLATGIIKPQVGAEVKIGSRISGTVTDLKVNVGDYVAKNQLLAILDDAEYKSQRDKAAATLETAKTNLKYAKIDFERIKKLKQKEYVSEQVLDDAQKRLELASSQVKLSQAELNYSKIRLEYTKIFTSIPGVVASVSTQKGETVSATITAPTFVTIIDLNRLEVWAYVDETDIGRIEVGQTSKFTVDTYMDTYFNGKVTAIYPQAEIQNNVVNYIVIIEIEPEDDKILRPEMTASVTIYIENKENTLAIRNSALKRRNGKYFVYVLENGQPKKREIEIGIYGKSYSEVIKGIDENDIIVLNKK